MGESVEHDFLQLPGAVDRLGVALAQPKRVAVGCVISLAALGWLYLALATVPKGAVIAALCRPGFGAGEALNAGGVAIITSMWAAMVLAMMLPSAAPMILTYAEIADTAVRKGERIVSPFVIAAGYSAVWLGFAVIATVAQAALTRAALLDAGMASTSAPFSGAIFIAAGLYQFSALKHVCLTQCRQPFAFFFTRWQTTPRGVFRLGLEQGLNCLGCCWAMMLVMFAVGVMNVVWMAALGAAMTAEKLASGNRLTYGLGVLLIAIGAAFMLASFGTWPPRAI